MKVIVAGGYGCGTTHVYRIARLVLEAAGVQFVSRGASAELIAAEGLLDDPHAYVLKTHDAVVPPASGVRVLLCVRELLDAAASHLRRAEGSVDAALAGVRQRRELEQGYAGRRDITVIEYEAYYRRPLVKVRRIAKALGVPVPEAEITRIARETGIRATKAMQASLVEADSVTELRPHHIGPADGCPGIGGPRLAVAFQVKVRAIWEGRHA